MSNPRRSGWRLINDFAGEASLATLNEPRFYDPEIVFFADELDKYK